MILTIDTGEGTAGKKDGSRAVFSAERRFLPHVQGSAGHSQFGAHAAGPRLARLAIDPAAFGAKTAISVVQAGWVVLNLNFTALTRFGRIRSAFLEAFSRTLEPLA